MRPLIVWVFRRHMSLCLHTLTLTLCWNCIQEAFFTPAEGPLVALVNVSLVWGRQKPEFHGLTLIASSSPPLRCIVAHYASRFYRGNFSTELCKEWDVSVWKVVHSTLEQPQLDEIYTHLPDERLNVSIRMLMNVERCLISLLKMRYSLRKDAGR